MECGDQKKEEGAAWRMDCIAMDYPCKVDALVCILWVSRTKFSEATHLPRITQPVCGKTGLEHRLSYFVTSFYYILLSPDRITTWHDSRGCHSCWHHMSGSWDFCCVVAESPEIQGVVYLIDKGEMRQA